MNLLRTASNLAHLLQGCAGAAMSQNRLNVVPTVSVLAVMKSRLQGATRGHSLLKKKADALTVRHASCRHALRLLSVAPMQPRWHTRRQHPGLASWQG